MKRSKEIAPNGKNKKSQLSVRLSKQKGEAKKKNKRKERSASYFRF
jgi:hypothetical protein